MRATMTSIEDATHTPAISTSHLGIPELTTRYNILTSITFATSDMVIPMVLTIDTAVALSSRENINCGNWSRNNNHRQRKDYAKQSSFSSFLGYYSFHRKTSLFMSFSIITCFSARLREIRHSLNKQLSYISYILLYYKILLKMQSWTLNHRIFIMLSVCSIYMILLFKKTPLYK